MPIVTDIQRFSVNDGPGIRTTVFLKGCPLRCPWCHNPESLSPRPQLAFTEDVCTSCRRCAVVCPHGVHEFVADGTHVVHFERCVACGACVAVCPSGALRIYGRAMTVEGILAEVEKDLDFYEVSDGGLTISGGECMASFEDTLAIARAAVASGISVCVETSGLGAPERYRELVPFVGLFLVDYKVTGEDAYERIVGLSECQVLTTLQTLGELGASVILRCPIIPGYNDNDKHLARIAELSAWPGVLRVEVLPYHDMGVGKARSIGSDRFLKDEKVPERTTIEGWLDRIRELGAAEVCQG
ncbi:glycyl-radical enzyme activating protein [Thermophilibacter sp.]